MALKTSGSINDKARIALVELLEQMRERSRIYADNMAKLSTDSGKTGPVYGMFVAGKTSLEPATVRRICENLKASERNIRGASFILAAWRWPDQIVAAWMIEASGLDVDRLVEAARERAARVRAPDGRDQGRAAARRGVVARR